MDRKSLQQSINEQWLFFRLPVKNDELNGLSLDLTFYEDERMKKTVVFRCLLSINDEEKTVYYWETSKDHSKGLFGDGDVDLTLQKGKTLYRKVKHLVQDEKGEHLVDFEMGQIAQVAKKSAEEAGYKFKVVFSEKKVSSKGTEKTASVKYEEKEEPKSSKIKPKRKIGISFWIAWVLILLLALVTALGLSANWIVYPIIILIILITIVLRRFLLKGFLKGTLLLVLETIAISILLMFNLTDQSLKQDTQALQDAFESSDITEIEKYLSPSTKSELLTIFTEHQSELTRIADLMETKKLIYSDEQYAEYEIIDNGQVYTMIFEKIGETWTLVQF